MAYKITVIILVVLCMAFLILGIYSAQHNNGAIAFFSGLFFGKISTNLHRSIKKQQKANRSKRLSNLILETNMTKSASFKTLADD